MWKKDLCVAVSLSAALLCVASGNRAEATSSRPDNSANSPAMILNMTSYRWKLPEFRMAGKEAYAVVLVENTHDYPLSMRVRCRTADGPIKKMSGRYTIAPREFLRMDTRRMEQSVQKGEGVTVRCRFHADGSAKIKAWVYDKAAQLARRAAAS